MVRPALRLGGPTLVALVTIGCVQFDKQLGEFDSAAGFVDALDEPDAADYRDDPERYPWLVDLLEGSGLDRFVVAVAGIEPSPRSVDNPSGFVRERMTNLVDLAADDLLRTAEVASRLLWVATVDPTPLNKVVAFRGAARLLERLDGDPLTNARPLADRELAQRRAVADLEVLVRSGPERREGGRLDDAPRDEYLGALKRLTERPLPDPRIQRGLIRTLTAIARLESDAGLVEPTRTALREAVVHGLVLGLHSALFAPSSEVREAIVSEFYALSGPRAVGYFLVVLAQRTRRGPNQYPISRAERLLLVELCGQLRPPVAFEAFRIEPDAPPAGPAPVEFLYDRSLNDPDEGIRAIALDALARSLGRPSGLDRAWADLWWREWVLERERGGGRDAAGEPGT